MAALKSKPSDLVGEAVVQSDRLAYLVDHTAQWTAAVRFGTGLTRPPSALSEHVMA